MIRGVVFDLDHTLFDRYGTLRNVLPTFYGHYRSRIPEDLSLEAFIERFILLEKRYIHFGWRKMLQACVEDGILFSIADEDFNKIIHYILHSCWTMDAVPYPFTAPTLRKLRDMGYKIGIITNGFSALQQVRLERTGLRDYFDLLVISEEVGVAKPNKKIFDYALEQAGNPDRSRVLMVGDTAESDILGGINAGLATCWLNAHHREQPEGIAPTWTVSSLHELEQLLCKH